MNHEQTLANVMLIGQESVQVLTLLATHIDRLGRETDAELISGAARDVAGVVLGILEQMVPDLEEA